MDISKLIAHPLAAAFSAEIPADAHLGALADSYCKLITHGDYDSHARALAIEYHIRTAATVGFHLDSVNKALSRVENALKPRKRAHNKILRGGPNA